MKKTIKELKTFLILWSTQSLSQLGSAMTGFALTLWLYEKTGSALQTALLAVCSYAPYVVMSIFAGALSDRWNKKRVMLVCDTLAACSTVAVLVLLKADLLRPVHMYLLNALNGLMNTVQQPAGDVAMTMITPEKHYQKTSGMRSFSSSLVTILNPVLATALFAFAGMDIVIYTDLATFAIAFLALLFGVRLPVTEEEKGKEKESFLTSVKAGIAMLIGSLIVTLFPAPKNRIRVIYLTMLFSLGTENFLLAFTEEPVLWCAGQIIGWILVPVMSANLDVIVRTTIPVEMQGRVYSCRNTLQFFTIPIGLSVGGFMVDKICEPVMARTSSDGTLVFLFGSGKGAGAAMMMFILGVLGVMVCLGFGRVLKRYSYQEKS